MRILVQQTRNGKLYVYDREKNMMSGPVRQGDRENFYGKVPEDIDLAAVACDTPVKSWNWQEWQVLERTA